MAETSMRTEQHTTEKGDICPFCYAKNTIMYQKYCGSIGGAQTTLAGKEHKELYDWKKLARPQCSRCGYSFKKGTKFKRVR